jgi:hypothetical protein
MAMMRSTVCSLILLAGAAIAAPAYNPRPCPIPALEALPPNPPPDEPSPEQRAADAAHWHSNAVAHAEEREAYIALVAELAAKQGEIVKDLDSGETAAVKRRAKILRKATKDKAK